MPAFGPISRRDLIRYLRNAGFDGPFTGGRHEFMVRGSVRLIILDPHAGDVGMALLARILRQAGLSRDDWERL